jgi:hypothetical protein
MSNLETDKCIVTDSLTNIQQTFGCAQLWLCGGGPLGLSACTCNASGCAAALDVDVSFDLVFSGDTAEGSNSLNSGGPTRFTREP